MPQYLQDIAPIVLSLLDDMAASDGAMEREDVEDLCEARELLAGALGFCYDNETNRYTDKVISDAS